MNDYKYKMTYNMKWLIYDATTDKVNNNMSFIKHVNSDLLLNQNISNTIIIVSIFISQENRRASI